MGWRERASASYQRRGGLARRDEGALAHSGGAHARVSAIDAGDPLEAMANLFDVAILLSVGFMIAALGAYGLGDLLAKGDVTIVKNPGAPDMAIIVKSGDSVRTLNATDETAEGIGSAVGTVYRLKSGETVWVPAEESR